MAYASRQSSYILGSFGAVLQVLAGWWDVYSHLLFSSVDPWWNPAHLTLYLGIAIVIIAVWRGLRVKPARPSVLPTPIRFVNVSGLKLAGVGSVMQIIAGIWNEIVHRVFLTEPKIAPAHALLTLGMLTISLGMIIGLTIEYGMIMRGILIVAAWKQRATLICIILIFSSIWLTAAGGFIYVARVFRGYPFDWLTAVLLAIIGTFVLVPAKRVLPAMGSATLIGLVFNSVSYLFLFAYVNSPAYFPWGILSPLLFDLSVTGLNRWTQFSRSVIVSSVIMGVLFYATYYPYTLYLFPWSSALQLPMILVVIGSVVGALLGQRVYEGLSSLVLGSVS